MHHSKRLAAGLIAAVLALSACGGAPGVLESATQVIDAFEARGHRCVERFDDPGEEGEGFVIDQVSECELASGEILYAYSFPTAADRRAGTAVNVAGDCLVPDRVGVQYVFAELWIVISDEGYTDLDYSLVPLTEVVGGDVHAVDCAAARARTAGLEVGVTPPAQYADAVLGDGEG